MKKWNKLLFLGAPIALGLPMISSACLIKPNYEAREYYELSKKLELLHRPAYANENVSQENVKKFQQILDLSKFYSFGLNKSSLEWSLKPTEIQFDKNTIERDKLLDLMMYSFQNTPMNYKILANESKIITTDTITGNYKLKSSYDEINDDFYTYFFTKFNNELNQINETSLEEKMLKLLNLMIQNGFKINNKQKDGGSLLAMPPIYALYKKNREFSGQGIGTIFNQPVEENSVDWNAFIKDPAAFINSDAFTKYNNVLTLEEKIRQNPKSAQAYQENITKIKKAIDKEVKNYGAKSQDALRLFAKFLYINTNNPMQVTIVYSKLDNELKYVLEVYNQNTKQWDFYDFGAMYQKAKELVANNQEFSLANLNEVKVTNAKFTEDWTFDKPSEDFNWKNLKDLPFNFREKVARLDNLLPLMKKYSNFEK
ncbi:hypothetical protein ACUZ9N_00925 [Mycoplasmopsis gallinarum]